MFFLFPRLEHPAGWICARYKSLLLLLLLIFCFISEVGTGSSSHDFDGDFMMSSLISVTQVGSNTESLQCGSLCGCDRMAEHWGERTTDVLNFCNKKVYDCIMIR